VARLRGAGAIVLGKANLSEWANFRSTHSCSGWSGLGGQTHNAYDRARNPSGSSAGSAVAAAASFCAGAIGTETNGSILSPSSLNGLGLADGGAGERQGRHPDLPGVRHRRPHVPHGGRCCSAGRRDRGAATGLRAHGSDLEAFRLAG
jgi:hypothetical protein